MSARLGECKHPRRLPSLSFGATTESHRSSQPLLPLTRSRQRACTRQVNRRSLRSTALPLGIQRFHSTPSTEVDRDRKRSDPPPSAPAALRPKPVCRRRLGRLRGVLPNKCAFRRGFPTPTEASERPHPAATSPTPSRPKSLHRGQSRLIHRHQLSRQREHARLLPIRHDNRLHRSASGSRERPGKPEPSRSSPNGAAIHSLPPEGDGVEQTIHDSTELLLPRAAVSRQACSPRRNAPDAEASRGSPPSTEDRPKAILCEGHTKESRPDTRIPQKGLHVYSRLA
jgi:hypothetical protein